MQRKQKDTAKYKEHFQHRFIPADTLLILQVCLPNMPVFGLTVRDEYP